MDINVLSRILDLSETILEALNHIQLKVSELNFEAAYEMLFEVVNALNQIDRILILPFNYQSENQLQFLKEKLIVDIERLVSAYEYEDMETIMYIMPNLILPSYQRWLEELNICLRPHIVS